MIVDQPTVATAEFEARTGWASKPEGLCKGQACVPAAEALVGPDELDIEVVAQKLAMPLVTDADSGVSALGPEAMGQALTTASMPALELPDAHGNPFALSSLHGRKVLLVAWASW